MENTDKDKEFERLLEQSKRHAGVDTLLEMQARYEKLSKKKNLMFRSQHKRRIITTDNTTDR